MAKKTKAEKLEKARRKMEKAERKLEKAARELEAAAKTRSADERDSQDIVALEQETTITLPPELAERLKSTGKGWQKKAEAALALWLDEASLALRRDGMTGLSATMKMKAENAKLAAQSGSAESSVEKMMKSAMNTVGRDIAQAALGAAFAAFGAQARDRPAPAPVADDDAAPAAKAETPAAPDPKPAPGNEASTRKPAAKSSARRRSAAKRGPVGKGKPRAE